MSSAMSSALPRAMPRPLSRVAAAGLLLLGLGTPLPAGAEEDGQGWIRRHLPVEEGTPWAEVERRMRVFFLATDVNGGGVTPLDHDQARRGILATLRAGRIANWARYDLDGDGAVTRFEITVAARNEARTSISRETGEVPTRDQVATVLEELVTDHMQPDRNGDGAVTFDEILAAAREVADRLGARDEADDLVPMALDADRNGVVTLDEYMRAVRSTFESIDRDGDGQVSALELGLALGSATP